MARTLEFIISIANCLLLLWDICEIGSLLIGRSQISSTLKLFLIMGIESEPTIIKTILHNISTRYCILFLLLFVSLKLLLISFIQLNSNILLILHSLYIENLICFETLFCFYFVSGPKSLMTIVWNWNQPHKFGSK